MQTDHQLDFLVMERRIYLPIRIESVIPHDIAGTDAPLYNALGPCLFSSLLHRASLGGHLLRF
jgi:hypothetical protein